MISSFAKGLANRLRKAWRARRTILGTLTPIRGRELGERLEAEKNALFEFTRAMEQEFLDLAALLRKIMLLSRQVKDRSDEVMAAASGRAEGAAIQFAFELLKKAEDLVHASRDQYNNVFRVFEKMHVELMQIARERSSLLRTLSPLEMTNTQFRIQACAFDEGTRTQFFDLADAIGGIVKDVQTAVGERFEELERTGQATAELVAKLNDLSSEQKLETDRMLAESRGRLSALNAALLSSEAVAQTISQAGEKIAGGVGKGIVALQCQDMARQKFQHIGEGIDDIVGHLGTAMTRDLNNEEEDDYRHFLADAGRVQLGQLQAVFEQLDEAARQVKGGLHQVDSDARYFVENAVRLGDATLDGEIIGRAIHSIQAVLAVIDNAVNSTRSVAGLVQKLKSTFSDCTSQILGLALRLRRVALNAQILAAHVDAGTALEVVAKNTRTIADEAMQQLDGISFRVTELVDLVVDLEQQLSDYRELAAMERNHLAAEAGESEQKLRTLEQELRSAVAAIGPIERELSDTIRRTTGCIRFPEAVAEANTRSVALFQQIVTQYSDANGSSGKAAHHKVQMLKLNYTMAHERAVHESAVEGAPENPADPVATSQSKVEDDDTLADNVELF